MLRPFYFLVWSALPCQQTVTLNKIQRGELMVGFRFGLIFSVSALLLCVQPAAAQPVSPTPAPPASSEWRIVQELTAAVQTLSATDSATENGSTILLGIGFVILAIILLAFLWKVAPPLFKLLADAAERERQAGELRLRLAESLERITANMNDYSTRKEDATRTDGAVEAINRHTDDAVDPLAKKADDIIKLLSDAADEREKRENARDAKLDEAIREMRELKNAVLKGDTGELNPAKVPVEPPVTAESEKKAEPAP